MDILQEIIAHKREELAALRAKKPSLREALLQSDTGIIAEFKRRSPSRGWIKEDGRADRIPLSYQQNGAAALSILTDEHYFGGSDHFIRQARQSGVTLPILYKNFVVDEAQLYAAALCGASAVLLIAACLTVQQCSALLSKAHDLGLEVLLEMHSEQELEYARLGPDLCGINNRNLGSFVTDVENSFRLADRLRDICANTVSGGSISGGSISGGSISGGSAVVGSINGGSAVVGSVGGCSVGGSFAATSPVLVSESGISDPATVLALRAAGFRGFLIGESFMKAPAPGKALADFISQISHEPHKPHKPH